MKRIKNIFLYKLSFGVLVLIVLSLALSSCNDEEISSGPVITRIYILDTIVRHKDSTIVGAEPFSLLVINGQNIGGVRHVYFNGFETSFNTNYNTDTDLIIRVPAEAPTDSTADNKIRLVTSKGETTFDFKIIAKASISSFDKINYGNDGGRDITFKGKNFADMEKVVAYREQDFPLEKVKDSVVCEIISKSPDKLVVRIPANTLSRVTLNFTNSSGTAYEEGVFVNTDVALVFFTEDFGSYEGPADNGDIATGAWESDTWGNPFAVTTNAAYTGKKSLSYTPDDWQWFGFTSWWPVFRQPEKYKYLTFAIKGGDVDLPLWVVTSSSKIAWDKYDPIQNNITVKAKIWNYFKIEITDFDIFYDGTKAPQVGFRVKNEVSKVGPIYIDDMMLIK